MKKFVALLLGVMLVLSLAAAQAELGQYDEAVKSAQKAEGVVPNSDYKKRLHEMLDKFRDRQPYRQPKPDRSIDFRHDNE